MKTIFSILTMCLIAGLQIQAQDKGKITIRKNIDGEETIIEREFNSAEEIDIEELLEEQGIDIDLELDGEMQVIEVIVDEEPNEHYAYRYHNPCQGQEKAFLGVHNHSNPSEEGAKIGHVVEGSSAEEMGLTEGDIITKVNGEKIENFRDLRDAITALSPNEKVSIQYRRDEKRMKTEGEIGQKQEQMRFSSWNGEDFHFEIDHENLEEAMAELEIQIEELKEIELDFSEEEFEAWGEEFAERMEDFSKQLEDLEIEQNINRSVLIIIEDINKEELDQVNTEAEPKLRTADDLELDELRFYPNPGDGHFELSFESPAQGDLSLVIFDAHGKKVYYEMLGDFEGRYTNLIDISRREAGTYYLQIEQSGKTYSRKIVKE